MGFNPLKIITTSLQRILKKKTKSMIKTNIEDRLNGNNADESKNMEEISLGMIPENQELCLHGYHQKNCPFCPPTLSVTVHERGNELKHGWLIVLEGLQKGRYFPIYSEFENKIGIAKECDIVLIGNNIASYHSTIYYNPKIKKFMLKDLSPEPNHITHINGESVPYEGEGVPLVDHMKLQFGDQVTCRFKCILD